MIKFDPLFKLLKERNTTLDRTREQIGFSKKTTAKFRKNGNVEIDTIDRICVHFKVPVEKVVYIDYENDDDINSY
jgi:DNA-binding Xre family transcriptional regulator